MQTSIHPLPCSDIPRLRAAHCPARPTMHLDLSPYRPTFALVLCEMTLRRHLNRRHFRLAPFAWDGRRRRSGRFGDQDSESPYWRARTLHGWFGRLAGSGYREVHTDPPVVSRPGIKKNWGSSEKQTIRARDRDQTRPARSSATTVVSRNRAQRGDGQTGSWELTGGQWGKGARATASEPGEGGTVEEAAIRRRGWKTGGGRESRGGGGNTGGGGGNHGGGGETPAAE